MKSSKSSLFLMELIIATLFFSLASAVCIQLFVKSHTLGKTTTDENKALLLCQNFSEIFLGIIPEYYDSDSSELMDSMITLIKEDSSFGGITDYTEQYEILFSVDVEYALIVCYDSTWNPCTYEDCSYQVIFVYEGYNATDDIYSASCYAYKLNPGDKSDIGSYMEIYHLNSTKHIPERM